MAPTPMTTVERQLTRRMTVALLSVDASPAELAAHMTHLAGTPEDALHLLNEAQDDVQQHLASVALLLRTCRR